MQCLLTSLRRIVYSDVHNWILLTKLTGHMQAHFGAPVSHLQFLNINADLGQ